MGKSGEASFPDYSWFSLLLLMGRNGGFFLPKFQIFLPFPLPNFMTFLPFPHKFYNFSSKMLSFKHFFLLLKIFFPISPQISGVFPFCALLNGMGGGAGGSCQNPGNSSVCPGGLKPLPGGSETLAQSPDPCAFHLDPWKNPWRNYQALYEELQVKRV